MILGNNILRYIPELNILFEVAPFVLLSSHCSMFSVIVIWCTQ